MDGVVSRVLFVLSTVLLLACGRPSEKTERFVSQYVESVYEETEFYRRFSSPQEEAVLEVSRRNMTSDFDVLGWDRVTSTEYEFAIRFSNGARGIVSTTLRQNAVESASLIVTPP